MPYQREQLMVRCADYLRQLAEIYSFGGTENRHILKDLEKIQRRAGCAVKSNASFLPPVRSGAMRIRWVDDVERALSIFVGPAHLSDIELLVRKFRIEGGRSWPNNADACIRDTLETHCPESKKHKGGPSLFEMMDQGSGHWKLRDKDVIT